MSGVLEQLAADVRSVREDLERLTHLVAAGQADILRRLGGPPMTVAALAPKRPQRAPDPEDDDEDGDAGPPARRERRTATIVKEAIEVLRRDPTRTFATGELRAAVACPEPRWPNVARELGRQPGVRTIELDDGRGRGYTVREQLAAVPQEQHGEPGVREQARQVAALLEATGETMIAGDIREAIGIASEARWRRVTEVLDEWPQVKVAGNRGGRRYRWEAKA